MLQGSFRRRCVGGHWDGSRPVCVGLSQQFNYSTEKPPTILFRHTNGQIAQSNDGQLVVTPGTIVHMECLWVRRLGSPNWEINNYSGRTYPQVGYCCVLMVGTVTSRNEVSGTVPSVAHSIDLTLQGMRFHKLVEGSTFHGCSQSHFGKQRFFWTYLKRPIFDLG